MSSAKLSGDYVGRPTTDCAPLRRQEVKRFHLETSLPGAMAPPVLQHRNTETETLRLVIRRAF